MVASERNIHYYSSLSEYRRWNEQIMWAIMAHLGRPESYADFGCGDGWRVRTVRMVGANPAVGIESSVDVRLLIPKWARILVADVTQPLELPWQFELVTALDVDDYIATDEEATQRYIANLVQYTKYWLVFSASDPSFWTERLEAKGLGVVHGLTADLRQTLDACSGPLYKLTQTILVLRHVVQP